MTFPTFFTSKTNAFASGSSFQAKSKRKLCVEESDDDDVDMKIRVRSPPLKRRVTFPPPDLVIDHSNSASDEDQTMDVDEDEEEQLESPVLEGDNRAVEVNYGAMGSGGFGFGPGAEEDAMVEQVSHVRQYQSSYYPSVSVYPSLTPNPHPKHFTNLPAYSSAIPRSPKHLNQSSRPSSPFHAQPFSNTLCAPVPSRGLLQPTLAATLSADASEVEKARAQHGPQCNSIPKLVMSQHPDPVTGEMSMWSLCGDCGACEKAA